MLAWGRNDKLFKEFLTKGFQWQRLVGDYFLAHGLPVMMPRMRIRGSIAQSHHFADEPDLVVAGRVIEVKSRSLTFQRSFDLPGTVILDTKKGQDQKQTKPFAFVVVSQPTGAMLWTTGSDVSGHWTVMKVNDSKRGISYEAYAARRFDFAPMASLVEELRKAPALGLAAPVVGAPSSV